MNWETLVCLGDSITIGARSYLGYPEYAVDQLGIETRKSWNVVNEAVSGDTTIDLVRRVTANFATLKAHSPNVLTVLIGTNDLKCETSVTDFKIAYRQLLIKSRLIVGTPDIVLMEIPELVSGVMLPYRLGMNERVKTYNEVIQDLGREYGLEVLRFTSTSEDFYDGVHLNPEGAMRWGKQLAEYILKMRR